MADGCFRRPVRAIMPACRSPISSICASTRAYSLSAGAIKIKELVELCRAEAMPAVAITDTGNLFGALEFATACAEAGIQPIIGCEIALAPRRGRPRPAPAAAPATACRRAGPHRAAGAERDRLPQPDRAWSSRAYLDGEAGAEPALALADLAAASDGPDLPHRRRRRADRAAACRGPGRGRRSGAGRARGRLSRPALYRAAAPRPARGGAQRSRARSTSPMRHDLPLVATNDAYFPDRDSTRRTTRCCASRRAASSPTTTAGG